MTQLLSGKKILAIDVGAGTQDILYYDPYLEQENNVKLVLPSQTQVLAKRIARLNSDVVIRGSTMGGGPISAALYNHIKRGFKVYMTPSSARTLRDDLGEVEAQGISIISEKNAVSMDLPFIHTKDVDLPLIFQFLKENGCDYPDFLGLAIQDHGFEKNKSDRAFRFEKIRETLEKNNRLSDFLYTNPPSYYSRMTSLIESVKKDFKGPVAVMDSKFAAIAGALHDTFARPVISVDIGNGHTMAASVGDEGILGLLEHHTHSLSPKVLKDYIIRLANGSVSNKEVFEDNGHGCYIKEAKGFDRMQKILVTGPHRRLLSDSILPIEYANPMGDVMMTGPVGLVDLINNQFN